MSRGYLNMHKTIIFKRLLKRLANQSQLHVEPPYWDGGANVNINGPYHMTKMATMATHGKTFKNHLSLNFGMEQNVLKVYKAYINDYPRLTICILRLRQGQIL